MGKWYVIGALVIIALALWYVYGKQTPAAELPPSVATQTQDAPLTAGDTTADISADLNQTADTSAALDADAAAASQAIQDL